MKDLFTPSAFVDEPKRVCIIKSNASFWTSLQESDPLCKPSFACEKALDDLLSLPEGSSVTLIIR